MQELISNVLSAKKAALEVAAYLQSLYKHFPVELFQTRILCRVEPFGEEQANVITKFPE